MYYLGALGYILIFVCLLQSALKVSKCLLCIFIQFHWISHHYYTALSFFIIAIIAIRAYLTIGIAINVNININIIIIVTSIVLRKASSQNHPITIAIINTTYITIATILSANNITTQYWSQRLSRIFIWLPNILYTTTRPCITFITCATILQTYTTTCVICPHCITHTRTIPTTSVKRIFVRYTLTQRSLNITRYARPTFIFTIYRWCTLTRGLIFSCRIGRVWTRNLYPHAERLNLTLLIQFHGPQFRKLSKAGSQPCGVLHKTWLAHFYYTQ